MIILTLGNMQTVFAEESVCKNAVEYELDRIEFEESTRTNDWVFFSDFKLKNWIDEQQPPNFKIDGGVLALENNTFSDIYKTNANKTLTFCASNTNNQNATANLSFNHEGNLEKFNEEEINYTFLLEAFNDDYAFSELVTDSKPKLQNGSWMFNISTPDINESAIIIGNTNEKKNFRLVPTNESAGRAINNTDRATNYTYYMRNENGWFSTQINFNELRPTKFNNITYIAFNEDEVELYETLNQSLQNVKENQTISTLRLQTSENVTIDKYNITIKGNEAKVNELNIDANNTNLSDLHVHKNLNITKDNANHIFNNITSSTINLDAENITINNITGKENLIKEAIDTQKATKVYYQGSDAYTNKIKNNQTGYYYSNIFEAASSAKSNETIIITNYNLANAILNQSMNLIGDNSSFTNLTMNATDVSIEGFDITNLNVIEESSNVNITGNNISGTDEAIKITDTSSHIILESNKVHTNNKTGLHIDLSQSDFETVSMKNNNFQNNKVHYQNQINANLPNIIQENYFDKATRLEGKENIYSTIKQALDIAKSNDNISVYNGTYNENLIINATNLQITGEDKAIINGNITILKTGVTLNNLEISSKNKGISVEGNDFSFTNSTLLSEGEAIYFKENKGNLDTSKITENIINTSQIGIVYHDNSTTSDEIAIGILKNNYFVNATEYSIKLETENDALRAWKQVNRDNIAELKQSGIESDEAENNKIDNVSTDVGISYKLSKEPKASHIYIPRKTTITNEEPFAIEDLKFESSQKEKSDTDTITTLKFGLESQSIGFNLNVKAQINVDEKYENSTLQIRKSSNGDDWTTEGLKNNTCKVANKECIFYFTNASYFTLYNETLQTTNNNDDDDNSDPSSSSPSSSSRGSSGGSSRGSLPSTSNEAEINETESNAPLFVGDNETGNNPTNITQNNTEEEIIQTEESDFNQSENNETQTNETATGVSATGGFLANAPPIEISLTLLIASALVGGAIYYKRRNIKK